jgi:zinc transport system ATP-binding protein
MAGSITLDEGTQQRHIGYLPQQAEIQRDFPASVQEVVQAGCLSRCGLRPYFNPYEKFVVQSNLQRLDIRTLAKKCYRELSGGQQQRVLLARALCAVTKLLLLDEPVAGLDPISAANTYRFLEEIHDRDKTAIVMISHDVATAVNYATHVLHLGEGTMLFFGTKSEYLKSKYGRLFIPQEGGIVR